MSVSRNSSYYFISLTFIIGFLIPAFCFFSGRLSPISLAGVPLTYRPALSYAAFESGEYQRQLDKYLLQRSGIWSWLVWMENTLNYHVFGIAGTRQNTTTLISKDNALFDRVYINDLNGIYKSRTDNIQETITALQTLQKELAKSGVPLIVMINPNKAIMHPEWVSSIWHRNQKQGQRYITDFLPALKAASIPFIEVAKEFDPRKYQYFLKSGAHMTNFGKCTAAKLLLDKIALETKKETVRIACEQSQNTVWPEGEDLDLIRVLNAYDPHQSIEKVRVSSIQNLSNISTPRTKILIAGTSYSLGILEQLRMVNAYSQASLLFYNQTQYFTVYKPESKSYDAARWPLTRQLYDIKFLSKFDVVILEATEARLHQLAFGLLNRYKNQDADVPQTNENYTED